MPVSKFGLVAVCTDVHRNRPLPFPNRAYTLPYAITPENLILLLRAKIHSTLTEVVQIPESLDSGQQTIAEGKLPFVGLFLSDAIDVSNQYPTNSQASAYPVDFVYVAKTIRDGVTDTGQTVRARLAALEAALYADFHLGGLVTVTETLNTPANKGGSYAQALASDAQPVTTLVLSMQFTLVKDIPAGT